MKLISVHHSCCCTAGVHVGEAAGHRTRWFRRRAALLICVTCALQGCDNRPAPSPTLNPHPTHTLKLKIKVEKGSEVNRVEVKSLWVVSNISCAPVIWPAGYERVKQVNVPETVRKNGDNYVATIVLDRFALDKCRWVAGGVAIKFYRNGDWISTDPVNSDVLQGRNVQKMTCLTRPFDPVGTCGLRDEESWYKSEDKNAFNASVELMRERDQVHF